MQSRLVARLPGRLLVVARVAEVVPLLRPLLSPSCSCRVPEKQVALAREDHHLVHAVTVDVADGGVGDVPAAGELGPPGRLDPVGVEGVQVVARAALDDLRQRRGPDVRHPGAGPGPQLPAVMWT